MDSQILSCRVCLNILDDPVECKYCNSNFCKEHLKQFKKCPSCKKPFELQQNLGVIKLLKDYNKAKNDLKIKMDNSIYQCNICNFEGNALPFCYHLTEEHKNELIEIFGIKKGNDITESTFTDNNNGKESMNEERNEIHRVNQRNGNDEVPINQSVKKDNDNYYGRSQQDLVPNCITERKSIKFQNPISKSLNDEIFYCGNNNQLRNCEGPSPLCSEGNCLCVKCMKYNIKKRKLNDYELINRAGKTAQIKNGIYNCGEKFKVGIRDQIGKITYANHICSGKILCPDCKILNKHKMEYLNYIYEL